VLREAHTWNVEVVTSVNVPIT